MEDSIILFHLPDSMHNYIHTLVNKIRRQLIKDLTSLVGDAQYPDSVVQAIITEQVQEISSNNVEE